MSEGRPGLLCLQECKLENYLIIVEVFKKLAVFRAANK